MFSGFVRIIFVVMLSVLLISGVAGAQARLLESTPVDGATLDNIGVVTFEFDTLLRPDRASVRVIRLDGTEVNVATVTVEGATLTAELVAQVPSGNYEVAYSVISSDGAENVGSIRLSVDSPEQSLSGGLLAVLAICLLYTSPSPRD